MTDYVDGGWQGAPAKMAAALQSMGWRVNSDNTVTLNDAATSQLIAMLGYRVIKGVAYVGWRSDHAIATPTGLTTLSLDQMNQLFGSFMGTAIATPTTSTLSWLALLLPVVNIDLNLGL